MKEETTKERTASIKRTRLGLLALAVVLIGAAWAVRLALLGQRARADRSTAPAKISAQLAKLQAETAALETRSALEPNDLGLHQQLLVLYHQIGRPDKEITHLSAIVRLSPDD